MAVPFLTRNAINRMIVRITFTLSLICYLLGTNAQQIDSSSVTDSLAVHEFSSEESVRDKRIIGPEQKQIQKGDNYVLYGQQNYEKALVHYLKAYETITDNAELNFKIGDAFLKTTDNAKSIVYLEKAKTLDPNVNPEIDLLLGMGHHLTSNFEAAIDHYKKYIQNSKRNRATLSPAQIDSIIAVANKKISECESGIELIKNPVRVFIDNIGDSINTEHAEYGPFITADESMLFFTSRRSNSTGGQISVEDYTYFEDIYVSKNVEGQWRAAERLVKTVNSSTNDAAVGISIDGQRLFIYRDEQGGDIYLSKLKGENWSKPSRLNKKLNTPFHESFASYSYDQRFIFFVSDQTKDSSGFGGKDIYVCKLNKSGKCEEVANLGSVINTPYDETCVFAHPDGVSLYFSSKGHNSMGGYDIFKSTLENGTWGKPENVGHPINTVSNDVSFSIIANGKRAYYSSSKLGGKGDKDIYVINYVGPEKKGVINTEDNLLAAVAKPISEKVIEPKVEIKKNKLTILKGIISDAITLDPLEATIEIIDNTKNESIGVFESNSSSGKYLVSLPSGRNYGIFVKSKGYLFYSDNVVIPASADYQVIIKDIQLHKLDVGSKVVLKNIFFDTDKSELRPESFAELNRLKNMLDDFPYLRIEISGHTDNQGSAEYNQKLSERRAKSVVDYLIEKNIVIERLAFVGYGLTQPIATNDTPEGRQMNRRTEFKILGTDYKPAKEKKEKKEKSAKDGSASIGKVTKASEPKKAG